MNTGCISSMPVSDSSYNGVFLCSGLYSDDNNGERLTACCTVMGKISNGSKMHLRIQTKHADNKNTGNRTLRTHKIRTAAPGHL